jgi:hypothetical protein
MGKLDIFLKEYAENANLVVEFGEIDPVTGMPLDVGGGVGQPAMDPAMMGGMPPVAAPTSTIQGMEQARKKEEEFISSDAKVQFVQDIKDALGIDPGILSSEQKGRAFSTEVTPDNAETLLADLRTIISMKTNPGDVN